MQCRPNSTRTARCRLLWTPHTLLSSGRLVWISAACVHAASQHSVLPGKALHINSAWSAQTTPPPPLARACGSKTQASLTPAGDKYVCQCCGFYHIHHMLSALPDGSLRCQCGQQLPVGCVQCAVAVQYGQPASRQAPTGGVGLRPGHTLREHCVVGAVVGDGLGGRACRQQQQASRKWHTLMRCCCGAFAQHCLYNGDCNLVKCMAYYSIVDSIWPR